MTSTMNNWPERYFDSRSNQQGILLSAVRMRYPFRKESMPIVPFDSVAGRIYTNTPRAAVCLWYSDRFGDETGQLPATERQPPIGRQNQQSSFIEKTIYNLGAKSDRLLALFFVCYELRQDVLIYVSLGWAN